jgi:putative endonuclease
MVKPSLLQVVAREWVASSKPYRPWQNVLLIEKNTRAEAMALEKKLKNLNRNKLLAFIQKYK